MNYDDYMKIVQENIQFYLDKGENPWQMPWSIDMTRNGATGRPYHGMNAIFLNMVATRFFDGEQRFYTWKQIQDLGLKVKKGSRSFPAYYFQSQSYRNKVDADGNPVLDEDGNQVIEIVKTKPFFMTFAVFNAQQLDPVPAKDTTPQITEPFDEEEAARIIDSSPVPIHNDQAMQAYYSPSTDDIHLPGKNRFRVEAEYYSTVFHEMTHSTGAPDRLNRPSLSNYRTERPYEELIAEIGSVLLCDRVKLHYSNKNSAAYIQHWQKYIKDPDFNLGKLFKEVNASFSYLTNPERRNDLALSAQKDGKNSPSEISTLEESAFPKSKSRLEKFDYAQFKENVISVFQSNGTLKEPVATIFNISDNMARELSDILGIDVKSDENLYLPLSVANELVKECHQRHRGESLDQLKEAGHYNLLINYSYNNKTTMHDAGVFSAIDTNIVNGMTYRIDKESKDTRKKPDNLKYQEFAKHSLVPLVEKHILLSNLENKANSSEGMKEYAEYIRTYCSQVRDDLASKPLGSPTLQFLYSKEMFDKARSLINSDPQHTRTPSADEAFAVVSASNSSLVEADRKMGIYEFDKFLERINAYAKLNPGTDIAFEYSYSIPTSSGSAMTGSGRFIPGYAFKEHLSDFAKTKEEKNSLENHSKLGHIEEAVNKLSDSSDPGYIKYAHDYVENTRKMLLSSPGINAELPEKILSEDTWKKSEELINKYPEKAETKNKVFRNQKRNR